MHSAVKMTVTVTAMYGSTSKVLDSSKKKKKKIRDEMHTEFHGQFKYNTM